MEKFNDLRKGQKLKSDIIEQNVDQSKQQVQIINGDEGQPSTSAVQQLPSQLYQQLSPRHVQQFPRNLSQQDQQIPRSHSNPIAIKPNADQSSQSIKWVDQTPDDKIQAKGENTEPRSNKFHDTLQDIFRVLQQNSGRIQSQKQGGGSNVSTQSKDQPLKFNKQSSKSLQNLRTEQNTTQQALTKSYDIIKQDEDNSLKNPQNSKNRDDISRGFTKQSTDQTLENQDKSTLDNSTELNNQLLSKQSNYLPLKYNNLKQENNLQSKDQKQLETEVLGVSMGNPLIQQSIEGKLHLYRKCSNERLNLQSQNIEGSSYEQIAGQINDGDYKMDCSTICVLAVPYSISVSDFCIFCGPHLQNIREVLAVRRHPQSYTQQSYMLILKFWDYKYANHFYVDYQDRPFNSYDDVICRLVFVQKIELLEASEPENVSLEGHYELPSCPVCLDRLDAHLTGIVTTICNHKFHQDCFKKWGDVTCPVCRYQMEGEKENSQCSLCSTTQNLWMCLICGNVGCGRYRDGHARQHFLETSHCFSLELETSRVWDYIGDHYVHRVIQSQVDGKLVEVPAPSDQRIRERQEDFDYDGYPNVQPEQEKEKDSKLYTVLQEYNNLIKVQLDSQRQYFERQMQKQYLELSEASAVQIQEIKGKITEQQNLQEEYEEARKQRNTFESKYREANKKLQMLQKERDVFKTLADNLQQNQNSMIEQHKGQVVISEKQFEDQNKKIKDLQEQISDLMGYFQMQQAINENSDIQGGSVVGIEQSEQSRYQKAKSRKEKRMSNKK